ncbi:FAD-dependent oxidoreductase [Amylibacter sp.]|nr:FAD-dependent oxidoreductase [Amylibacter sp.]
MQRRQPSAHALPRTAAQVARAFADIRASGDAFAIQSSGHCFAGLSQTSGALIDLRYLNQTTVDPDKKRLIAGPDTSIAAVNRAMSKHGLVLPAGHCQTVALGGHVGGGGIGILSRKYGLACDHLIAPKC